VEEKFGNSWALAVGKSGAKDEKDGHG